MTKAQLAIEIGFDKIRACACIEGDTYFVPLGSDSSPYEFPPIGVKSKAGYKFGEVARLCAVTAPDSTVFLYDYLRQNTIPRDAMISFLNNVKERTEELYGVGVDSIALITPPYFKDLVQSRFLDSCIKSVSNIIYTQNTSISFSSSFLNVCPGQRVLFLDFRSNPAYISLISRGSRSYETIGAIEIEDFSSTNCENYVEDKILSKFNNNLIHNSEIVNAWIQGDIASTISRDAIHLLMSGKDISYEIPFIEDNLTISQSEFSNWLIPQIDKICEMIIRFTMDSGLNLSDLSHVVLLGSFFGSRMVRERIEKFMNGYNQEITYSQFSFPMDEWKICESALINNVNNKYALKL